MVRRRRTRARVGELLEDRRVLDSTVVFNEIMYHPADGDAATEWIELHNQMALDMDISEWSIDEIGFRFPERTTMPAGGYVLIAKDPNQFQDLPNQPVYGPFTGRLDNGGETLTLRNFGQRVMDEISYGDRDPWPAAADGAGVTLAKRSPQTATEQPGNWTSSITIGGTPGAENFPTVDSTPIARGMVAPDASWSYEAEGADLSGTDWQVANYDDSAWAVGEAPFFAGEFPTLPTPSADGDARVGAAISIQNPSFEMGTNDGVGYGDIPGWTTLGSTGINPTSTGTAPFLDNSTSPDQKQVGFIQGRGSISQVLSGFVPGEQYWLELHYNARNCCGGNPSITVSLSGSLLVPPTLVEPIGGDGDFYRAIVPFTATADVAQLLIRNVGSVGDHTLLLDAVSIVPAHSSQVVMGNPSFEASGSVSSVDAFSGPMVGWQYEGQGSYGVVSQSGSELGDVETPDGGNAAALKGKGSLRQTIDGLIPGRRYQLQHRYRAGNGAVQPQLRLQVGDRVLQDALIDVANPGDDFQLFSQRFTASRESMDLIIEQRVDDPQAVVLLDDLIIREEASVLETELPLGPTTHYFRHEFEYAGNPSQTQLILKHFFDDGAAVYLNGEPLFRYHVNEELDANSLATVRIGDPAWSSEVEVSSAALLRGTNVIAVETHQASVADSDMAFALELIGNETPLDPTQASLPLVINEVEPSANELSIELWNHGPAPISLADLRLLVGDQNLELAGEQIAANSLYVASLAGEVDQGGLISLVDVSANRVLDAVHITDQILARDAAEDSHFYVANTATLGTQNQVMFNDAIVINEIMYHQVASFGRPAIPPTYNLDSLLELDSIWRYEESGDGLPSNWHEQAHAVGGKWQAGKGLLGFETGRVISPGIGTEVADTNIITYYFETEINVSADDLANAEEIQIRHAIDDGAVFYLNGSEFYRFNMPQGPISPETTASVSVNNAVLSDSVSFPVSLLREGENRISVELHQRARTSSDVIFGLELALATIDSPGEPEIPFTENPEEWVELFNRSAEPVDLGGWALANAIDYDFAAGTILEPGGYLVVAKDPATLAEKYPAARIVGPFDGRLNNRSELILLRDALGNPADEVNYFDSGRWPSYADGGGSTLELVDPRSDNSVPEAWSASVPDEDLNWKEYRFRVLGEEARGFGAPSGFHEWIIGLLDSGVVLLDDIELIQDPDGSARSLIQNGTFEGDTLGESPAEWRFVGNHDTTHVAVDPKDPENKVLRLEASGATEHMSNHGETTFADRARVADDVYEVSFRGLWLHGSSQLNSRIYFARGTATTLLERSDRQGTPGAQNSVYRENQGPVYLDFGHDPPVPQSNEPVEVSAHVEDPDGVSQVVLHYSVAEGPFTTVVMDSQGDGQFTGTIPGQSRNRTVQFYVTAEDSLGVESSYPSAGAESRALYTVAPPLSNDHGHGIRILMTRPDISKLHRATNVMSNGRLGATVIYNDSEIFYDVGVRMRASGYGRRGSLAGFNIQFDPMQLFRGVHKTIALDRGAVFSNGNGSGVRGVPGASPHELLIYQIANHAGGIGAMYDDIVFVDAPRSANTGMALLKMARYSSVYLDSQFEDGSDGTIFKYELIYYATNTSNGQPDGIKNAPNAVIATEIRDLGDDKEAYRWNFIIKNNRTRDDYSGIMELGKTFSTRGEELETRSQEVMDIETWMRTFALQSLVGTADTYNMGLAHNLELFHRPDGKMIPLPWDVDHGFYYSVRSKLTGAGGSNLARIINLKYNQRIFHKHLLDMVETTYNTDYLGSWAKHYEEVTQHENVGTFFTNYVDGRSSYVLDRLPAKIPFEITTNDAAPLTVDDAQVVLEGKGWIDVHEIREKDSDEVLPTKWLDDERWQVTVPLRGGENPVELVATNLRAEEVGTASINVTSTLVNRPLQDHLRIVEVMYNPPAVSASEAAVDPNFDKDDFEFVELLNTSDTDILDLSGVQFSEGPASPFTFEGVSVLAPGGRLVLVNNPVAFNTRYPGVPIGGIYEGNLRNSGERLRLQMNDGSTIVDFEYGDDLPWATAADGQGSSLVLKNPSTTSVDALGLAESWAASAISGGTPGTEGGVLGDTTGDGVVDAADIDYVCQSPGDQANDLNRDGVVDTLDVEFLVTEILGTTAGDANLDGTFDSTDFVTVFVAGEYEDGIAKNSGWASGDWNCDQEFTSADLVTALMAGSYTDGAPLVSREIMPGHDRWDNLWQVSEKHDGQQEVPWRETITRDNARNQLHLRDLVFDDFEQDSLFNEADHGAQIEDEDWLTELSITELARHEERSLRGL